MCFKHENENEEWEKYFFHFLLLFKQKFFKIIIHKKFQMKKMKLFFTNIDGDNDGMLNINGKTKM